MNIHTPEVPVWTLPERWIEKVLQIWQTVVSELTDSPGPKTRACLVNRVKFGYRMYLWSSTLMTTFPRIDTGGNPY